MPAKGSIEIIDLDRWRQLAPGYLDYNYQQCWAYTRALALRRHAVCENIAIVSGAELLGLASVRIRTAPVLKCGVAHIAAGPLTRRGRVDDVGRLTRCLEALQAEYVHRRGLALRILAPVGSPEWNRAATATFEKAGMVISERSRSYRTFLLNVRRPPAVIRKSFAQDWHRNLRRGEQASFAVRIGTAPELFDPIRSLYEQLRHRTGLETAVDVDFCAALQPQLGAGEQFTAGLVELDGEPVAGMVWSMLGDTCVPLLLAADESGFLNYAVYLLQWRSIVMADERGMRYYDLGGVDPEVDVGVYNFKKGLRGIELRAPGPFELMPSPAESAVTQRPGSLARQPAPARPPEPPPPAPATPATHPAPAAPDDAKEPALPPLTAGAAAQLRRAKAGDVEQLITLCHSSFPDTLRWQVGGGPARDWWHAALPSASCETWVSVHDDDVQGFVVLVTDENRWAAERRSSKGSRRQWLTALVRRPWTLGAHVLRTLRRRGPAAAADAPTWSTHTPPDDRTRVEMIAVAARHWGPGIAADLIQRAESRTRELDRHAVQMTVKSADPWAIHHSVRSGYGLVHETNRGLILGKRIEQAA